LIFEKVYLHYYAIIIILEVNGLRTTILLFIAIISWTIYPAKIRYCLLLGYTAKFVIVTGHIFATTTLHTKS